MKKKTTNSEFSSEKPQFIDSHCHLDMDHYQEDFPQVLDRAKEANVCNIITIGIDEPSSQKAVKLAKKYPQIFASIGVHPHDVENIDQNTYKNLTRLHKDTSDQIKAFGEIGLDYYKNYSDHKIQREQFIAQMELAKHLQLPVIIHSRDADEDCYNILKSFPLKEGAVMHCFGGNYAHAKKLLDLGMYISLSGIVTFKNANELHDVAKKIPLDRMLIETDGPFLAPSPFRGKRNEPAHIQHTAAKIAELREISMEEVAHATTENTRKFFRLPS